jgi:cytochrome P450
MATFSWLYELSRAPVPIKARPSSSFDILNYFSREWVPSIGLPDFNNEIEQVKSIALYTINQTCTGIDKRLHVLERYAAVEGRVADYSQVVGLGHVSPGILLNTIIFLFIASFLTIVVTLRIQKRRRHKRLYGNNAFPPYTRATTVETIITLMNGSKAAFFYKQCAEQLGSPVFRLRLPLVKTPMYVAVGDLETAKEILQDPGTIKSEPMYASIAQIVGSNPNILTTEGPKWKTSRKAVSPAFLKRYLDRMHLICKTETEEWINNRLKIFVDLGQDFDITKEMVLLTLSILCSAALEYNIKPKEGEALVHELNILTREFAFEGVNRPWRGAFGIFYPSVRRARLARTRVHEFAKKILQTYRLMKSAKTAATEETVIGCIARNKKYENDGHRIADIVMFLFAGVDNTADSLAWTMMELAEHPEELAKLKNALNGKDDFKAQEMLKDVLREGMRLRPPVPGIGLRTTGRDFYLKDKSIVIPKGSQVFFPSLVLTRYGVDDPEEFRPSRWREHPDKSFLLFSSGKRNCVGQSLAFAEITWVLSRLCAKYDFEVTDDGRTQIGATVKLVGARMRAHPVQSGKK